MYNLPVEELEQARLNALNEYNILGTADEAQFNSVAWLASYICKTPIALISFIDETRQWIKAKVGTDVSEIPRDISFCNVTIQKDDLLMVADMSKDERFIENPSVKNNPSVRFYAGTPLITKEGYKIGSICVIDFEPRTLDEQQKQALSILSKEVIAHLETRKSNLVLKDLLEKAQKFHNLFNNSSELHCITDSEGKLAFVNSSITDLLGYSVEEVVGKTIWDFCVEGERERVMPAVYEEIAKGKNRFQVETLVVTKDGSTKWFEWADVIMDGYWLVNGRDITERKAIQQKLQTLSVAVEKSPVGVLIRDKNSNVVWMNEASEALIGYKLDELQGKEFGNLLIGPKTDLKVLEAATKDLYDKKPYAIEIQLYKKDGAPIWLLLTNNPLFDEDGNLNRQITIALDITLKKQAEEQLIKAKQDAIDLSKSKEVFLSVMSHEMRTPLNAVIGMTHILKDEDPLERQLDNLKILEFSAQNLLTLINDVLDYTKIETGNLELERAPVNLEELISKTVESLKFKAHEQHVEVLYQLSPQIPKEVLTDSTRLYQILMNLLGNSVKFTHQGHVKIIADYLTQTEATVTVKFTVEDTGIGIAADKLGAIFDAYSQAEVNTSRKYGGTGLGLSITRKLVELFGSVIKVESTLDKGTSFSFIIKFNKASSGKKVEMAAALKEVPVNAKILVVDDNAINRLLAKKVLEKWSIITDFAENGEEAVEKVKANEYDLVFMDIHMPVMGGEEAVKIIRELGDEKYTRLPILALTGTAPRDDEDRFLKAGMNDFVLKPFDPHTLYKKIMHYLKKTEEMH